MTEKPQELIARLVGFTPGPWEWASAYMGLNSKNGQDIMPYFDYEGMHACEGPNADLIAAAPDLHRELAASLEREAVLEQQLEGERDNARAAYERGYWERGNGK